ncbi:polymerase delta-interacting protein 3-like isoform X3 [Triplophysa dalaica]|uniref:polymerase delta-interacting protein 3-like isoform X3 n=1 Tax=Triplophysa dalaica TaxID=1582913 RepID=UPI0024E024FA|nr:polymerase delta-interacting protein 3-like isoform X3 [Triplophysa dalaica]
MADLSLDEVIRRRNVNVRGSSKRPMYGRGAVSVGRAFDARQKIGTSDVRQRLGVGGATAGFLLKDAREKLGQKDARSRIRGRGGATSAVQDARQMLNSRKQQQTPLTAVQSQPAKPTAAGIPHIHIQNTAPITTAARNFPTNQGLSSRVGVALQPGGGISKVVDARDRLSLKRSAPSTTNQKAALLKITKTIQQQRPVGMTSGIRINVPSRASQEEEEEEEDDAVMPSKQMKITTAKNLQTRMGSGSLSAPFTKVVKNDSYTPASVSVPPSRPAARPPTQTLQPVSRTTVTKQPIAGDPNAHTPAAQPVCSPLEGTKITVNNLHPRVTEEDIVELFCVCGALKRARMVKVGVAEVVFVRKEDAVSAYRKYNNRCLDGQPMKCNLHIQGNIITSEQPILLRLSDTPGAEGSGQKEGSSRSGSRTSSTPDVDPQTILKALFKSSSQQPNPSETPGSTAFRIKI